MSKEWLTKTKDLLVAQSIMEQYASSKKAEALGLLDLVLNVREKKLDFQLADWVHDLALTFNEMYGADQGDFVTRLVLSICITQGQTLH